MANSKKLLPLWKEAPKNKERIKKEGAYLLEGSLVEGTSVPSSRSCE